MVSFTTHANTSDYAYLNRQRSGQRSRVYTARVGVKLVLLEVAAQIGTVCL